MLRLLLMLSGLMQLSAVRSSVVVDWYCIKHNAFANDKVWGMVVWKKDKKTMCKGSDLQVSTNMLGQLHSAQQAQKWQAMALPLTLQSLTLNECQPTPSWARRSHGLFPLVLALTQDLKPEEL